MFAFLFISTYIMNIATIIESIWAAGPGGGAPGASSAARRGSLVFLLFGSEIVVAIAMS